MANDKETRIRQRGECVVHVGAMQRMGLRRYVFTVSTPEGPRVIRSVGELVALMGLSTDNDTRYKCVFSRLPREGQPDG